MDWKEGDRFVIRYGDHRFRGTVKGPGVYGRGSLAVELDERPHPDFFTRRCELDAIMVTFMEPETEDKGNE